MNIEFHCRGAENFVRMQIHSYRKCFLKWNERRCLPKFGRLSHRRRELEQNQTGLLVGTLARLEVLPFGGQSHAMRGFLEEAEKVKWSLSLKTRTEAFGRVAEDWPFRESSP